MSAQSNVRPGRKNEAATIQAVLPTTSAILKANSIGYKLTIAPITPKNSANKY